MSLAHKPHDKKKTSKATLLLASCQGSKRPFLPSHSLPSCPNFWGEDPQVEQYHGDMAGGTTGPVLPALHTDAPGALLL